MKIYNYDPITGELTGVSLADESPLEPGVFLIPAHATDIEPPATGSREAAAFADGAWSKVADFRGVVLYSTTDGTELRVSDLGPQPADTTELPRPSTEHDWNGTTWVQNLGKAKAAMWLKIKAKRDAVTLSGTKVGTKWYHSDESSRDKYHGLVRMADAALAAGGSGTTTLQYGGQDIQWKTMDGTFIKMTVQRANDVFSAVSGLDFIAFGVAEAHRVKMLASPDPAAYDFSADWPANFGG